MFVSRNQRRRAGAIAALSLLGTVALTTFGSQVADAFKYPDDAQARLLLDGTQTAPHDGFNMQIDTNGFTTDGGDVIDTHMFCINATLPYRCGLPNELVRVQADPSVAGLSAAQANRVAWLLTNRDGYNDEEVQHAIWCVTDPGEEPAVGGSDQICTASAAFAVPVAPTLSLSNIGSASVTEGTEAHFSLVSNAKTVDLSVSDGGAGPVLCGSALDNASATIAANVLTQTDPVATRSFELCLTRDSVADDGLDVTLNAALEASVTNLQVWVHPDGASSCQGVIDAEVSSQRLDAEASARWNPALGSLTIRKSTVGDFPAGTVFTVHIEGESVSLDHDFPDADGDPYEHTFADLPSGTYMVTETATGGATTVEISNSGVAIVDRATDTIVDVVNSSTGNLVLEKVTDIASDETFSFVVECVYLEAPVGKWNNPVSLASGETFDTDQLPAGSTCSITETDSGGAESVLFVVDIGDTHTEGVGAQAGGIGITPNATVDVVFTNVFTQGSTTSSMPTSSVPGSTSTEPTVDTVGTTVPGPDTSAPGGNTGLPITGGNFGPVLWLATLGVVGGSALSVGTRKRRAALRRA
jgi:hypothetical protein